MRTRSARLLLLAAAVFVVTPALTHAQEDYQLVVPGKQPSTELVRASDGHFYGVSILDGIYRFTPPGSYTPISDARGHLLFQGTDHALYAVTAGEFSRVALDGTTTIVHALTDVSHGQFVTIVEAADGFFYGFTRLNGDGGLGTVFRLSRDGDLTTLRSVGPAEGPADFATLTLGRDGFFYGTNWGGELSRGTIFRMNTAGAIETLHTFTFEEGDFPRGQLLQTADGTLYGMTVAGGAFGFGSVYRLRPGGEFTVLHHFTGGTGLYGGGTLMQASDGDLYGSVLLGVFRLTAAGEYQVLHSVANTYSGSAAADRYGSGVNGAIAEGPDGNFYGTVRSFGPISGGRNGGIFRLNRLRSACANAWDLEWQDVEGPTLYMLGVLKSETPALIAAILVSAQGIAPLWFNLAASLTPTWVFEFALPFPTAQPVGVYTVVVTSTGRVCADWTTATPGGAGASTADLERILRNSGILEQLARTKVPAR